MIHDLDIDIIFIVFLAFRRSYILNREREREREIDRILNYQQ